MTTAEPAAGSLPVQPRRGRLWTALGIVLTLAAILILAAGAFATYLARRSLPVTSGTLALSGLTAPVTVVRDHSGIPHITGANAADVFRAQGYVQAQDRLWQMDFYRRVAPGRLSEVLGQATVKTDIFLRTMGLHRAAEKEYAALPPSSQASLQEFADGVNAYLDSHQNALPLEFAILGYTPEHWSPIDTVAFGKVMALDLSGNYDLEIAMADLQAKLGVDKANELLPTYPDGAPSIVEESSLPGNPLGTRIPDEWRAMFGDRGGDTLVGSNNWVIDGQRSATGRPLLANDPHLAVQNPSIWYAIQLRAMDGSVDVEGVAFALAPGVIIGHNRDIVWGVTNLGPDTQDLYVERLDPAGHPGQYEYRGQWLPLEVVTETIQVKGQAPVIVPVQITRHGPIMNPAIPELKAPTALQWTALMPGRLFQSVLELDQAANWQQFREALSKWDVPGQNFVYADSKGNVGYQATGRWPIRMTGNGLVPVKGWSGAGEWTGFVPYEQMPTVLNPSQHYIATANNRVVKPNYPYLITGFWGPWFRAERIGQMITAKDKLSVDDFKAMHYDTHDLFAAKVGRSLAALHAGDDTTREAIALFDGWDGDIRMDSSAAALFEVTYHQIITNTFGDELGNLTPEYADLSGAAAMKVYGLLDDPNSAWWDDVSTSQRETRDDILFKSIREGVKVLSDRLGPDMNKWSWGGLHTITFDHRVFGKVRPLNRLFNFGPFPMPGDGFTVGQGGYDSSYAQTNHPSMRMITDPGDWGRTQLIFSPGESGELGDGHWGDMVDDYLHARYRTLPWTSDQIMQDAEATLTLRP